MRQTFAGTQCSRRRVLISLIGSAPFAVLSGGGAAAGVKVAQSAAHYQPTPNEGQACAGCYAFVAPNQCKFLAGEISPSGWCRLWKAKEDQEERHA
jgi:High potential iron-sulfur protein